MSAAAKIKPHSPESWPGGVAEIANAARALAHPLRVGLLQRLGEGENSPKGLAKQLGESLSLTAYHIAYLRDMGMVEETRRVERRGALEHYYRVVDPARVARMITVLGEGT